MKACNCKKQEKSSNLEAGVRRAGTQNGSHLITDKVDLALVLKVTATETERGDMIIAINVKKC
jgi:hypothetical protein